MQCRECKRQAGGHVEGCVWGADISDRYFRVVNLVMSYQSTGRVEKLREAHDRLSELIAWAEAYEAKQDESASHG